VAGGSVVYIREDMATINVKLNSVVYGDTWKEAEGGNLEADVAKARPGGMGREVSAGGPASRQDLTVRVNLTDTTATWLGAFEHEVGVGDVEVNFHWLNRRGVPLGISTVRRGILQAANLPNIGTGSDPALLEIVIDCNELST
jgi:hypothetical protein